MSQIPPPEGDPPLPFPPQLPPAGLPQLPPAGLPQLLPAGLPQLLPAELPQLLPAELPQLLPGPLPVAPPLSLPDPELDQDHLDHQDPEVVLVGQEAVSKSLELHESLAHHLLLADRRQVEVVQPLVQPDHHLQFVGFVLLPFHKYRSFSAIPD